VILRNRFWTIVFFGVLALFFRATSLQARPVEFVVYEVHQNLSLGGSLSTSSKEYYVNFGLEHGVKNGDLLQVSRRVPTYDLINQQFYREVVFPIARLRVIHSDLGASVCRLERILSDDSAVSISPKSVMVGDLVRPTQLR